MKVRQSHVTLEMGSTEPLKSQSQPTLQREQKHETENKNNCRVMEGGGRAAGRAAVEEVTGGQLHFGVVTSHRSSPCSKRRTSVSRLPCLETVTLPKLKSISVHFPEFSILHTILFFFTRNKGNAPEGPTLLTKTKWEAALSVHSVHHPQLPAQTEKMGCSCLLWGKHPGASWNGKDFQLRVVSLPPELLLG